MIRSKQLNKIAFPNLIGIWQKVGLDLCFRCGKAKGFFYLCQGLEIFSHFF